MSWLSKKKTISKSQKMVKNINSAQKKIQHLNCCNPAQIRVFQQVHTKEFPQMQYISVAESSVVTASKNSQKFSCRD